MSSAHPIEFADIFGYPVAGGSREQIVDELLRAGSREHPVHVLTLNPEIVVNGQALGSEGEAVRAADFCVADGVGISWSSAILSGRRIARYPGIDLALDLIARLALRGGAVYLLGAKPGVAERAAGKLTEQYRGLKIAGFRDGYFAAEDEAAVVANIADAKPDLLLVGMGSPRQEGFITSYKRKLGAPLLIGVGGAFDVLAGDLPRAPRIVQQLGLEWVFRALMDTARLRRLASLPRFLWLMVVERVRQVS